MSFSVDRIPGTFRIDPDAAGQERHKRGKNSQKRENGDSVSISEEARRRLTGERKDEAEEAEPD
jgi:hypothetical protein